MEWIKRFFIFNVAIVTSLLPWMKGQIVDSDVRVITVDPEDAKTETMSANETVLLMAAFVNATTRYALFEAHCQRHRLTMSFKIPSESQHGDYVTSNDVGLVVLLQVEQKTAFVYLKSHASVEVKVLIRVRLRMHQDPIPGGCNMEFDVSVAPYLRVTYDGFSTTVSFQRSSIGFRRGEIQPSCDTSYRNVSYDIYTYYIDENDLSEEKYFDALRIMGNVKTITRNAQHLKPTSGKSTVRFELNTYRRHGIVINIVASNKYRKEIGGNVSYVAAVSYGCRLTDNNECNLLIPFEWFLVWFGALAGIFLCFFGHRYFTTSMASFGFLTSSLIVYVIIARYNTFNYSGLVSTTVAMGIIGGALWALIWKYCGSPFISVLIPGCDLGFLFACIISFTPLGSAQIFKTDFNYWPTMFAITLLIPTILISYAKTLHILSCTVIGSYGIILLLDCIDSGVLHYIVVNVIRRATIRDYNNIVNATPFQISDIVLVVSWCVLIALGLAFQTVRETNRPPFPAISSTQSSRWCRLNRRRSQTGQNPRNERDPLIQHFYPHQTYQST